METGDCQGEVNCQLHEMEVQLDQQWAVMVEMHGEMGIVGKIIQAQTNTINTQNYYLAMLERKVVALERRNEWGRTIGNLIIIKDNDNEVTLVEGPGVVCCLILIED